MSTASLKIAHDILDNINKSLCDLPISDHLERLQKVVEKCHSLTNSSDVTEQIIGDASKIGVSILSQKYHERCDRQKGGPQ